MSCSEHKEQELVPDFAKTRVTTAAVMLAYCRPATLLAHALLTVVVADAGAPAYHAHAPAAVMLAYLQSATVFALALGMVVVADA